MARAEPTLLACGAVNWLLIAPARAVDEPAHLPSLQDYVAQNKDFLVGTAAAYIAYLQFEQDRRQADVAFRASDEYKIKQAVEKFLRPYEVTKPQKQVVKRDVIDIIKRIISDWQPNAATIISGRHLAGKTVAVNEALRGVRGALQVSVQEACQVAAADDCGSVGLPITDDALNNIYDVTFYHLFLWLGDFVRGNV